MQPFLHTCSERCDENVERGQFVGVCDVNSKEPHKDDRRAGDVRLGNLAAQLTFKTARSRRALVQF